MSPKWFRRVRELFQDGFVASTGDQGRATQSVRKALRKSGKSDGLALQRPQPLRLGLDVGDHGAAVSDRMVELLERQPDRR